MIDIKKASQIAKKFFKTDKCYDSLEKFLNRSFMGNFAPRG